MGYKVRRVPKMVESGEFEEIKTAITDCDLRKWDAKESDIDLPLWP